MRVAAIDIGTVTSRLFIADVSESGVMPLCRKSVITNLGEGVDASGRLSDDAIARTVDQVARYKETIDEYAPIDSLVALATSASRDAENSDVFVDRLRDIGVELSVIPGSREAELSFLGASNDFRGEDILFADIGGGSTELAFGRAYGPAESVVPKIELRASRSFDIGCRRMTERFLKSDPPSECELAQARAWALETLAPFFEGESIHFDRLVAVAGTPTSVVAVRDSLVPYDSYCVHKTVVAREEFDDVARRLCALPLEKRKKVAGIQPKRAGVFPAGVVILDAVMSLAKVDGFTASESDILIGIVLDALCS
ncbi:Ppx/GppA family phosphatase [Slackia piriformis]|uniref:Ppx/GppA phosphatase family protein n=1 Tax=Slackia piriformis TaxID=626934 RepID=UPI0039F5CC01